MDRFDFVVIGAGAAGEAAANKARQRGASVAIIDRDLVGGSCSFWACIPSKSLLHSAAVHAGGGDYPWPMAADRRDYNINRIGIPYPDDALHVQRLQDVGAVIVRGTARLDGPGRVVVTHDDVTHELEGTHIVVAVGSQSRVPNLPGLDQIPYWTNREATSARELPESLLVLGGGPTGVELAQVYARYGVPVTIVDSNPRILARDHPRNSAILQRALERAGATIHTNARAVRVHPGDGNNGRHRVELNDGSSVEGSAVLLAIGRVIPLDGLGLETVGVDLADGRLRPDARLQIAEGVWVAGDPAGPELHTHVAHYEGEIVVRIALGDDVRPDFRAIPRATYTDPETASVGLQLEEALKADIDAVEFAEDLATSAKGFTAEAEGHVIVIVDRARQTVVGVFLAGPGASEAIHEAVLAVKLRTPLSVLADTIHAFPTLSRVMGGVFAQAAQELGD
ncbi:MAG TPA: NAD(P)/FAD-dependent oxidoreductase [Candidatus Limnocylindria bacterium]|nr:NAD(P)/FAD-dependent oxidoreductase [Candidatus Limnocylindria bacterium]